MSSIRQLIQTIAKEVMEDAFSVAGTVESVTTDPITGDVNCVVQPFDLEESKYLDIKLQAAPGKGILIIPTVNSVVMISLINESTGYVSLFSDVDSIKFLDGSFDGIVKINDLVTRMNIIEDDINDLKTVFSTWVVLAADGGAALKTAVTTWFGSALTNTEKSDMENTKIKHGTT